MPPVELCARFHKAIELVGGRWTGAVLQVLLAGRARFSDIGASIPDISDRMLSDRLRALESEGLVVRHVIPESPVRVEYELTTKGRELQASLNAISRWAEKWIPQVDEPAKKAARHR
jgi:DNA-binding HxlR family transcriptional regulator